MSSSDYYQSELSSSESRKRRLKSNAEIRRQEFRPIQDINYDSVRIETFLDLKNIDIPEENNAELIDYLTKCYSLLNRYIVDEELELNSVKRSTLRSVSEAWRIYCCQNTSVLSQLIRVPGKKNWSLLMFFWLVICSANYLESREKRKDVDDEQNSLTGSDFDELIKQELLWNLDKPVLNYSQLDIENSAQILIKRWTQVECSFQLENYIRALERRCAELVVGPRNIWKVFDSARHRHFDNRTKTYGPNDEFIFMSSVWFMSFRLPVVVRHFSAHQWLDVKDYVSRPKYHENEAINLEMMLNSEQWNFSSALLEQTEEWILERADECKSSKFLGRFREIYMDFVLRIGEKEKQQRDAHGEISTSNQILSEYRNQKQVEFIEMKFLRDGKPRQLIEQRKLFRVPGHNRGQWSHLSQLLSLKVIDTYFQTRYKLRWLSKYVIFSRDYFPQHIDISIRGHPVVIENFNDFNVLYENNVYQTRSVAAALLLWCRIVQDDFQGQLDNYLLHKTLDDILKLKQPVEQAESLDDDQMDIDVVEF